MLVSRTIIAAVIAGIPTVLLLFGITYEISIANQEILVNAIVILISLVGVVIFRYKAKIDLETKVPLTPIGDIKIAMDALTKSHISRPITTTAPTEPKSIVIKD